MVDITQLRYFLKVAELENFTRASEELGVSQPALSRSIAKIEDVLGQPVFERQARKVVLTDAGRVLHERAIQVVQLLDEIPRQIRDDGQTGTIRIGAIPTIAPYWLPKFLDSASKAFPQAHWVVREDVTEKLLQACNQGEVDLVIAALPVELGYLDSKFLFEEELLIAVPQCHELANSQVITASDIDGSPLVMLGDGHCLSDQIDAYCRKRAIQQVTVDRTTQLATLLELVARDQGISFIPKMAVREMPSIAYKSMVEPAPTRTIAVVWNSYRFESQLQKAVREHMEEVAKRGY